MDDGIVVRPLVASDMAQIGGWSGQSATRTLFKLPEATASRSEHGWVATENDLPIAIVTISLNEHHIGYLDAVVKPSERRRGIGAQLVSYALDQPAVTALHRLHALVERDNVAAQKILTTNGFSRIGYTIDGRLEFARH